MRVRIWARKFWATAKKFKKCKKIGSKSERNNNGKNKVVREIWGKRVKPWERNWNENEIGKLFQRNLRHIWGKF